MNNKHKHWVKVPQRVISIGEKLQAYRLERQAQIKASQQAKRNRKQDKRLVKEELLSRSDNEV